MRHPKAVQKNLPDAFSTSSGYQRPAGMKGFVPPVRAREVALSGGTCHRLASQTDPEALVPVAVTGLVPVAIRRAAMDRGVVPRPAALDALAALATPRGHIFTDRPATRQATDD